MAVVRKASLALTELRDQERDWILAAIQREHPNVALRFRVNHCIQQKKSSRDQLVAYFSALDLSRASSSFTPFAGF